MSFDAGTVIATLGARFTPSGFTMFGAAMGKARADMDATEKRADEMSRRASKSFSTMGQAAKIGAGGGILALGGAIAYSIKKAADFEQQLSSLQSVSGATGKQMGLLKQQALDAGAATKYSALQAAQAQTELAKGGLTTAQILKGGLSAALALASAGELDLADAATYTVNAIKLFKLHAGEAGHVADALATAANSTTADVKDFGMALVQGGGAAKAAGYSFDQTVTILEALAEVGVKNSDAGTSMKTALLQLVGPTKKQAEESKAAGISFLDQSGKMKGLADISDMLRQKTGDMTKAQRTALFQNLAGTDGFRTLLALYDAGPSKLDKLTKGLDKQGTAAQVAATKQDNLKGKIENLQGSVETAAIRIGSKMLPALESMATKATAAINSFVSSGQADSFASGIINVLKQLGSVAGTVIHDGTAVAGVLLQIGQALDLGDADKIKALALAFVAFKTAGVVVPIISQLATGLGTLVLNMRTAPSLAAFFADLPIGPLTAISLGVAGLAAGILLLSRRENDVERAARKASDALQEQGQLTRDLSVSEHDVAGKTLAAQHADIDLTRAKNDLSAATKKYGADSTQHRDALLNEQDAAMRAASAHNDLNTAIGATQATQAADRVAAHDQIVDNQQLVDSIKKKIAAQKAGGGSLTGEPTQASRKEVADLTKQLTAAQEKLNSAYENYSNVSARTTISDLNQTREMSGKTKIIDDNIHGFQALSFVLSSLPQKVQTKYLLDDQDTVAKLGLLGAQLDATGNRKTVAKILTTAPSASAALLGFQAILAGVPARKVVKIEQNAPSAAAAVNELRAAIDALHDKTITLSTNTVNTISTRTGRDVTSSGKVLQGRADGGLVTATPTLVGEDGSGYDEYVVPTNPQHRGRAIELFTSLAGALGLAAAKGKGPGKGRILPPPPANWRVGDPDDLKADITKLEGIADDKIQKGKGKGGPTQRALEARKELKKYRETYNDAHKMAARIDANASRAENAYAEMQLDDKKGDGKAYDAALKTYNAALKAEQGELTSIYKALGKVGRKDTVYGRAVNAKLLGVQTSLQDALGAAMSAPELTPDQQSLADTGMTLAEVARQQQIQAGIALADLTPDIQDDKDRAADLVSFLTTVLGEIQADPTHRGGDAAIASVAGALKTAKDNAASFTPSATAVNTDADTQAQIDQAFARGQAAGRSTSIDNAAALAFGGPGAGPTITQNIYTLHPGDSRTQIAVGNAAAAGFGIRSIRRAASVKVGL